MTANDRIQGVFHITPVSAVHIGSGNELIDFDYEIRDREFRVKDVLKYIEDQRDNPEAAVKAIEDGLPLGDDYIRYRMPCYGDTPRAGGDPRRGGPGRPGGGPGRPGGGPGGRKNQPLLDDPKKMDPQMRKLMKQSAQAVGEKKAPAQSPAFSADRQSGPKVREFIKDPFGNPYLPGSTLKGCLRTAIAYVLSEHCPPGPEVLRNLGGEKKATREWIFDATAKKLIFGDSATNDVLKALIVRDSAPLDITKGFAMTHVQVRNIMGNRFDVKQGMPIYTESLTPAVGTIEIPFCLDLYVLNEKVDRHLDKAANGHAAAILRDPAKFAGALQKFSEDLLQYEIDFYNKQGANNGASFLNHARRNRPILLDLGFGTGWNAKTVGLAMDSEDIYEIRRYYGRYDSDRPNKNMGSKGVDTFPKTRKWAATAPKGEYHPMGWVALEIEWK